METDLIYYWQLLKLSQAWPRMFLISTQRGSAKAEESSLSSENRNCQSNLQRGSHAYRRNLHQDRCDSRFQRVPKFSLPGTPRNSQVKWRFPSSAYKALQYMIPAYLYKSSLLQVYRWLFHLLKYTILSLPFPLPFQCLLLLMFL